VAWLDEFAGDLVALDTAPLIYFLYATDQAVEVARLEQLGAARVPWEYSPDPDFVVLADPSGNEFCVVQSPHTQD
jgi:Glyoxalase-like domain